MFIEYHVIFQYGNCYLSKPNVLNNTRMYYNFYYF